MVQDRISEYIREMGIKQTILCKKTGLDKSAMSAIVTGKRKLSANEFEQICKALGKQPNDFMEYEENEAIQ